MIKKISIFSLFLSCSFFAFGQQLTQKITGTVISGASGNPVIYAQVAVYSFGSTRPLTGTTTNDKGIFQLSLPEGVYDLAVLMVGFEEKKFTQVLLKDKAITFGTIILTPSINKLEEVVVRGGNAGAVTGFEGVIIHADQNLASAGGSVLDILRSAAAVSVNGDGTVKLRGSSSTNVLINGRTSTLTTDLEQISANTVESIQIINNPNAKYDAQAAGGIINIKLKKEQEMGTNGEAEFTIGTRYRMNNVLHLNHRTKSLNLRGGYSYKRWPRVERAATIREERSTDERLEEHRSAGKSDNEHTLDLGADYWFGRNKLSYEGIFNTEKEDENEQIVAKRYQSHDLVGQDLRKSHEIEDNYTIDNALIFEHWFEDSVREFKALISHSFRDEWESQHLAFFSNAETPDKVIGRECAVTEEIRNNAVLRADYAQTVAIGKLSLGYKFTFRSADDDYNYAVQEKTGQYINLPTVSNRFVFKEQVHAAYFLYDFTIGKFKLFAGTRLEGTTIKGKVYGEGEAFSKGYLNLFPSLQMLYNLNEGQSLKFTFSRRIARPKAKRLNPFPDITDSLNIELGNPDLDPEYIQSFELGHIINLSVTNFTYNFFYRHVAGEIDDVLKIEDGVSYSQPANLHSSKTIGLEIINSATLFPWWTLNTSFSLFRTKVDGSNLNDCYVNSGASWNAKLNSDFKLFYGINVQLNANYTAPEVEAQGHDFARYYLDVSILRNFFHDRASLSITCRDVFNTLIIRKKSIGEDYIQNTEEKKETRIFLATLDYKF